MRIMDDVGKDFWSSFSESSAGRTVTANNDSREEKWSREASVTPNAISGNLERHSGLQIDDIPSDEAFLKLVKTIDDVRRHFSISELARCGMRIYYFDKIQPIGESVKATFESLFDREFISQSVSALGEIEDIGFCIDGKHKDKLEYHFRCGPYFSPEADKYIEYLPNEFSKNGEFNFVADIDLFERSFVLKDSVSIAKWCGPLFSRLRQTIGFCESLLTKD